MFPAERRGMRQEITLNDRALGTQMLDGQIEVDGVPVDDGRGGEAEPRCSNHTLGGTTTRRSQSTRGSKLKPSASYKPAIKL